MTLGKARLSFAVALAYLLVIAYASLQPFEGWRTPPREVLGFLTGSWPRYVVIGDVTLNVIAYLPLGALFHLSLRPRFGAGVSLALATVLAALVSLALESVQMFLPGRIASNLDVLTNSVGAALGALIALLLSLPAAGPLHDLRDGKVRTGTLGDFGLLIVALWIVIQFHPRPLAFSSGDWRGALHLIPQFAHTPGAYLFAESGIVALAIIVIASLVSLILKPQQPAFFWIALTLLATMLAKSAASAMLARPGYWWQWLTPGLLIGLVCGLAVLMLALRIPARWRAILAIACTAAGVVLVNATPENPYYETPVLAFAPQATHLGTFSHIVGALSLLWPVLVIAYLAIVATNDTKRNLKGF